MRLLTTRELAEALGVSESSMKRWVDAGKIAASRTDGGHRRIELGEALRFIRATGSPVVRPELLDLPEVAAARDARLADFVLAGNDVGTRGWLVARYLEGATIASLADGPIREAMHQLGELWHHDDAGVYVEHRGTDILLHAVSQLRTMMAPPVAGAPVALGGAPAGDPYLLASQLAGMVLGEQGMAPVNLGPDTPVTAMAAAVAAHSPSLIWLSVSTPLAPARARSIAKWLETLPAAITVVVGGRQASMMGALPPRVKRVSSMAQLAEIGASVVTRARAN